MFFFFVIGDQLIKAIFLRFYPDSVSLNTGFAFGINPLNSVNLVLAAGLLLFFVVIFKHHCSSVGFQMVVGGGVSNILDRILYGAGVDYISLFGMLNFNLADMFVVAGTLFLALHLLFSARLEKLQIRNN